MEYLKLILTFLAGGGLLKGLQIISNRKKTKLDYTEQYTEFLENNGEKLIKKLKELEKRISDLEAKSCERPACPNRITSIA